MSRCERLSFWSAKMFHGEPTARFTFASTIGRRAPAHQCSISCMYSSPCDEVAVNARSPVCEAPAQVASAECSDSTATNRASRRPSAHISASSSTTPDEGVIG